LRKVGDGGGGSGFNVAAGDRGNQAGDGGAEIAGRDIISGEEIGEIIAEFFRGFGFGLFAGMVETEVRMRAGAWSATTAAIGKCEKTQGRAVLWAIRGHVGLLRFSFDLRKGEIANAKCEKRNAKCGPYRV